jgi:chaperonin cofactor prefoldin
LSKRDYEYLTGRNNGSKNVLAYHIRQAFKPGETDAKTANAIGYDLALSFTKGKHAFIVATHTDKKHIHNHIIFNSTAISCERKFNDFKRSGKVVRRISDLLCVQNGLSIIENPKPSKGRNYGKWFTGEKEPSWQDKLRSKIDEVLPSCAQFEDFIAAMIAAGYAVNTKRKYITFLAPGQKKPTRLDTLKGDHTEAAVRKRLSGGRIISSGGSGGEITKPVKDEKKPSLLIDIQAKIREGKGAGYEKWARMFNIKESAKTLIYLKEKGIDSYDDLVQKATSASAEFSALSDKIKGIEARLKEITELQKYIGQYGKTREIYQKYKASKWDNGFYEENRADITLHRAAKKYFDGLGLKKIPKMNELKQEYAELAAEKKKLYAGYHEKKEAMRELVTAKSNCANLLGVKTDAPERDGTQRNTR